MNYIEKHDENDLDALDIDQVFLSAVIKLIEKLRVKNVFPYIVKYSLPLTDYDEYATNKFNEKIRPTIILLNNADHSFYKQLELREFLIEYLPQDHWSE